MFVIVGYILAIVNLIIVLSAAVDSLLVFADVYSLLCVFGGTAISIAIGYHPSAILKVFQLMKLATKKKEENVEFLITSIVRVGKETQGEITSEYVEKLRGVHPFFRDSLSLIADGFTREQIEAILTERVVAAEKRFIEELNLIRTVAKIAPSFGLLGTTIGLVGLFSRIGDTDALKKIGPSMAVALITTLYGLVIAFLIINPLYDRMSAINNKNIQARELILKGVLLLKDRSSAVFIEEILKSYLTFQSQGSFKARKAS